MSSRIVIVGGGLSGLAAAVYLAREGRTVTVFERKRQLGGRAVTHLRHGFRFNLGPHAVYKAGISGTIYKELGIPIRGGIPKPSGIALLGSERYRLPTGFLSTLFTSLLSPPAKAEAIKLAIRLSTLDPATIASLTWAEWLDQNISDANLRLAAEALARLATYSGSTEQSAEVTVRQLQLANHGVVYVHEGWQKIVDALHSHAVTAGVTFITSSHVVGVEHDGKVQGIQLGELELDDRTDTVSLAMPDMSGESEGTLIKADRVLLAVDPATATRIAGIEVAPDYEPVSVSCLDVALKKPTDPKKTFALGLDRPLYYSLHSNWAQLTPKGGALLHAAHYHGRGPAASQAELEGLVDEMQPGWRDVLVHKRYLPALTVSNALIRPGTPRVPVRTRVQGLYVAGDWVGDKGMLSDAALSSAREAARAILADG